MNEDPIRESGRAATSKTPTVCAIVAFVLSLVSAVSLLVYYVLSKSASNAFPAGMAAIMLLGGAVLSLVGFIVAIVALAQSRRAARRALVLGLAIPALIISIVTGIVYAIMALVIGIIVYACSHIEINGGSRILLAAVRAILRG